MDAGLTLVTGGAGFIGAHLTAYLMKQGYQVAVIDNLSSGNLANFDELGIEPEFVLGDISDSLTLSAFSGRNVQMIYHLAAQASVPKSVQAPLVDFDINVRGTLSVLEFARLCGATVIFPSTVSVYSPKSVKPIVETAVVHASSPYGAAKAAGENYCFAYANCYGIRVVVARLFNVYGPLMAKYVIHDFVRKLQANPAELTIIGDGEQRRDYLFVSDAVRALVLLAEHGESGEVYNLGSGLPTRITDLAYMIIQELELRDVKVIYTHESVTGDIHQWYADTSRLQNLGFVSQVPLPSGLRATIQSLLEN